jgi:hypothetical protein
MCALSCLHNIICIHDPQERCLLDLDSNNFIDDISTGDGDPETIEP